MKLIIQISDKHGERLQRLEPGLAPVKFGRGWNNDVILEDKYVDPLHFSLQVDEGRVSLQDHATTNGTQIAGRSLNSQSVAYQLGEPVLIGDTTVRIFDVSQSVEPAMQRSPWFRWLQQFRTAHRLAMLTLLAVAVSILVKWGFSVEPFTTSVAVVEGFNILLSLLLWSVVCSSVSKLVRRQSHFLNHWAIACIAFIALEILYLAVGIMRFNLQHPVIGETIAALAYGLLGILVLYAVFSHTTAWRPVTRVLWSIICAVGIGAVSYSSYFLQEEHERWTAHTRTEQATFPPAVLLRSTVTVDQYMQDAESLFEFNGQIRPQSERLVR